MRILYLCHYFAPEPGAPSARLLEMSREWVRSGHTVKVVTCFPNHPTGIIPPRYRGKLRAHEEMDGIEVFRNWVYATPNEGFVKKTLGHLSFMVSSVLLSTRAVGDVDVIIVSSPTFFSAFSAWAISRLKRVPFVFEVRDLWPAALVELGVLTNRRIIRTLEALEMGLYRRAAAVVNVTRSFCDVLEARGVPRHKLFTVTNGVDADFYRPMEKDTAFRRENGLSGRFVVLYTGAHGISHALGRILEVAETFRDHPEVAFAFVGEGAEKAGLMRAAEEKGLPNVHFFPAVPKARMPEVYASADACLVPLRDVELFKTFIPSKMFEIMAAGRPIVASVAGEAREILCESGGALVADPEDVAGIGKAIRSLLEDPRRGRDMGARGREFVLRHYTRRQLAEEYLRILQSVVSHAPAKDVLV